MKKRNNPHRGSDFEEFLRADGLLDEAHAEAVKRVIAEAVEERMEQAGLSKLEMARRMGTSRSQLDRVLDPAFTGVQLDTLIRAAHAVGHEIHITLRKPGAARRRPRAQASSR